MKHIFFRTILSTLILLAAFIVLSVKLDSSISFVKTACAHCWGTACNTDPYYQTCPQSHVVIAGPIDSADIHVSIINTGSAPIPPNQPIRIYIHPASGPQANNSCSEVTCLNRIEDYSTNWNGPIDLTFDRIGCATNGTCVNDYLVEVNFIGSVPAGLNCPSSPFPVHLQNNSTVSAPFDLHCSMPEATCTTITDQQQCQQNTGTTSGCVAGWHPNPDTTKTCDQTGGLNTCCIKDVCTKPTQPTNVRVTCSGCQ